MLDSLNFLFEEPKAVRKKKPKKTEEFRAPKANKTYIIAADSFKTISEMYLQFPDGTGYWTVIKSKARVFNTRQEAEQVLRKLRFNNPRIIERGWEKASV